jgi:RNA polymerase sigma-70 factor (ECF subfamily)
MAPTLEAARQQRPRFPLHVGRLISPVRACQDPGVPDELHSGAAAQDPDAARVAQMATGSTEALAALYDSHATPMFALAQRMLGDRRDAEDLVHDVFLEAWRRSSAYDPARGSVRSWLLVRVRSRALDRRRALEVARRHASGEAALAESILPRHPELELISNLTRARARQAIDTLPEGEREIMRMACLEELTIREIAARCGLPVSTVNWRLSRAKARVLAMLGAVGKAD